MNLPISVVIPVGPLPHQYKHWKECFDSVCAQTHLPTEIIKVTDGIYRKQSITYSGDFIKEFELVEVHNQEKLGIAEAFNTGVKQARNDLVFLLGSDDRLYPRCLELCYAAYQIFGDALGWYSVGVEYSNGFTQNTPCLAAMVTRTLWNKAGGLKSDFSPYPSCEIEFISRMILAKGELGATYRVSDDILYWHRIHTPGSVGIG